MSFHRIILRHEQIPIKQWAAWLGVATNTVSSHWKNLGGSPSFDKVVLAFPEFPLAIQDEVLALFPRVTEPADDLQLAAISAIAQLLICQREARVIARIGACERVSAYGATLENFMTAGREAKRCIESAIETTRLLAERNGR